MFEPSESIFFYFTCMLSNFYVLVPLFVLPPFLAHKSPNEGHWRTTPSVIFPLLCYFLPFYFTLSLSLSQMKVIVFPKSKATNPCLI